MDYMDDLKTFLIVSLSSLMAYLSPISGVLFSVIIVFVINFMFGYITAIKLGETFSFIKAFSCIKEAATFFILIAATYSIGEHMNNPEGALQSISIVTYTLLYFYAINVFKNMKRLFPKSMWIAFCYYAISMEFVKKVPFLTDFINSQKNNNHG